MVLHLLFSVQTMPKNHWLVEFDSGAHLLLLGPFSLFVWLHFYLVCFEFQSLQVPSFMRRRVDPKNVVSIILGGGPGKQLFPLTQRAATPAVSESWFWSES